MTDRIKEFIKQSTTIEYGADNGFDIEIFDKEKFAELIIKECARVQHERFCEHGDVSWDILMAHFGIL